ncbi:MAG TPA: phosphatase PAP2 family protein [Thermoanaerobaculia bacterium]|jgi:membrane-associated phospholipid phosphatase|nr:phosphatase PAP2 family protein [Thermoanaerobaculia bacterium]
MESVRWLQHLFGPGPHTFFLTVTYLGASLVLWTVLVLYHWLIDPEFARRLAIVMAASVLTHQTLKVVFGTPRPYDLDVTLSTESARLTGGGPGFPSGHAMNAATFWFAFAFRYGGIRLWMAAVLVVSAVALSRVYLGVHMPADVAGGLVLGAVFAWAAGRWATPRSVSGSRRLWGPLVGLGSLALAFVAGAEPAACGLLAGCCLARPAFEPPRTLGGRLAIVLGGAGVLALLGILLAWLPERIFPGLTGTTVAMYFLFLALALVAFDLWPRVFASMRS